VRFPDVPKRLLASKDFLPWLATQTKKVAPLVEWLTYATR
jgi:hypothetical protein